MPDTVTIPDLDRRETQYLVFEEMPRNHRTKTRRWSVRSKRSNALLGQVSWYGAWRQFTFRPQPATVFNIGCLLDINAFMTDAYTDWRLNRVSSSGC